MKPGALFLIGAFCGLLTLVVGCGKKAGDTAARPPAAPGPAPFAQVRGEDAPETVLVTVNQKSLTRAMAANMARESATRRGIPPEMLETFLAQAGQQLEQQAVQQFIGRTLLESEAARLEVAVSEAEVDAVVTQLTARLPEGVTVEQALSAQGVSLAQLRQDIQSSERIRKLYESKTVLPEPITEAEVEAFYKENPAQFKTEDSVQARHILIACDDKADAEAHAAAKAEAEAIRRRIEEGADFAEVAREKSACPSKEKGGALGTFGRGRMVPEFDEAAFSQKVGELGPVVKTSFGYHVIEVTGKQEAGVRSLEDAADDIRQFLTTQAKEKLLSAYLDTLREQADIKYGAASPPSQ